MIDWVTITRDELTEAERAHARQFLADADGTDHCDEGYTTLMNAGGWTVHCPGEPVTDGHVAELLAQLVELRRDMPRRAGWRFIVDLVVGRGQPGEKLRAVYARETGIAEDHAFPPALDPDMPEGRAVVAEEIRRTRVYYEAMRARDAENARRHAERVAQAQARRRLPPIRTPDPGPDPRQMALDLEPGTPPETKS
ncbi:hypothetical protein MKK88_04645 [Methylobacterium sp. E-005]|uniref:hypothetical protein n=1 Tax=Methylobacterium sp. E-005 TaxID=2836549 RepID=UPI001FBB461F|nr:hypothetical protein [Methylobacterium sp. E-005]MCJ2085285.1 hypothetical protein [Methylobacterium sp. E-005]